MLQCVENELLFHSSLDTHIKILTSQQPISPPLCLPTTKHQYTGK